MSYYGDWCPACGGQRPTVMGDWDPRQVLIDKIEAIARKAGMEYQITENISGITNGKTIY
jgi:RNA polymerase subunit RPABC4/transcription elongation factor Spt4